MLMIERVALSIGLIQASYHKPPDHWSEMHVNLQWISLIYLTFHPNIIIYNLSISQFCVIPGLGKYLLTTVSYKTNRIKFWLHFIFDLEAVAVAFRWRRWNVWKRKKSNSAITSHESYSLLNLTMLKYCYLRQRTIDAQGCMKNDTSIMIIKS